MQIKNTLSALAASVALASAGSALAASDGNLQTGGSATSTGTSTVTLTVPQLIKISNMNDITLTKSGSSYTGSDDVCVYRNTSGQYSIQAQSQNDPQGNGNAGKFVLSDGSSSTVEYSVNWGGSTLQEETSKSFSNADTTQVNCGGSGNITVTLTATETQVGAATATGTHTDTLSLMVTPQ